MTFLMNHLLNMVTARWSRESGEDEEKKKETERENAVQGNGQAEVVICLDKYLRELVKHFVNSFWVQSHFLHVLLQMNSNVECNCTCKCPDLF